MRPDAFDGAGKALPASARRVAAACRYGLVLMLLVLALGLAGSVEAREWADLSTAQKAVLSPWQDRWAELDEARRAQLLEGARRWQEMTPDQRARVRERVQSWHNMTPEQRARARQRMQRFDQLPAAARQRIRAGLERLRELPPEQREHLRQRWEEMDPQQRRAFIAGAIAGRAAERNSGPLLSRLRWRGLLEREQRLKLRSIVQAMDTQQRRQLQQRMRELDDAGRARLARALIDAAPDQREALLEAEAGAGRPD